MLFDLDDKKIQIHKNNKTIKYDILFTFDSLDTKKTYIGYTNHTFSKDGRKKIYLSAYNPLKLGLGLENIKDQKEIQMIRNVLMEIDKASKKSRREIEDG